MRTRNRQKSQKLRFLRSPKNWAKMAQFWTSFLAEGQKGTAARRFFLKIASRRPLTLKISEPKPFYKAPGTP